MSDWVHIQIGFRKDVVAALRVLAEREMRDPRAQASLIVQKELERIGLLSHTTPPTHQWINVGEILPKEKVLVLAYDGNEIFTGSMINGVWCYGDDPGRELDIQDVTHWALLPPLPSQEKRS
jgi:hypothetical protein